MRTASSGSATVALRVPTFTSRELYERIDDVLGEDITGTVYSLKGYPSLVVKKISLDGLDRDSADTIKAKLTVILTLSHSGILKYHQVVEDEGLIYIVMDRHDTTLEDLLIEHKRRGGLVFVAMTLSIVRQVAAALAYLHSVSGVDANGLVHRDLRPANIVITEDRERFVIAGLGLSRDALWSESTFAGTAAYMAPEVLLRNEASPASDMWSLGVILYELATLRRPDFLEGKKPAEVFVDGWRPDLSAVADDLIKGILERIFVLDPEKRLTAKELYEMLTVPNIPVNELGAQYVTLRCRCNFLETVLSDANARIALLKNELKIKSDRIVALEEAFENRPSETDTLGHEPRIKTTRIDAFEGQDKKDLATIQALEARVMQRGDAVATINLQPEVHLLPKLIHAAYTNDTETVQMLINEEDSIGQRDEQGMTALMHAVQQGHVGPVKLLAEKEKGLQDKNGWTALMHAVHNNHSEVVEIIAPHEYGKRNKDGHTALMIAAEEGSIEAVSVLAPYEKGLTINKGKTALMIAAEKGHAGAVSVLAPYEKNLVDSEDKTALTIAAEKGHEAVVEALDPTDDKGVTALMRAVDRDDIITARALVPFQRGRVAYGETALMRAAMCGNIDAIRLLLPHEGGIRNRNGATALMKAASRGYLEAAKLLMKKEVGMKDNSNTTALMRAAARNQLKIITLLINYETCIKDNSGATALMKAASRGHLEAIELLIKYEAGKKDNSGATALMKAASDGHLETAELLMRREAGRKDNSGMTALMKAALRGCLKVVELLFEDEGHLIDKSDKSFFNKLEAKSHFDILSFLSSNSTSNTDGYSYS